eukprot:3438064-Pyramimonas_sp.AAC.2
MAAPVRVTVGERNTASSSVTQRLLFVGQEEGKLMAVRQLIQVRPRPAFRVRHALVLHSAYSLSPHSMGPAACYIPFPLTRWVSRAADYDTFHARL